MNRIDASEHYDEKGKVSQTPSLLTVIIDTNPRAWAAIRDALPLAKALANILVFINAHLAFGNENQVAVIAAHTNRAVWLYPTSPNHDHRSDSHNHRNGQGRDQDQDQDVEMTDVTDNHNQRHLRQPLQPPPLGTSANKYPRFAQIESSIIASLQSLIETTNSSDLKNHTTLISGALTMALSHIHKTSLSFEAPKTSSDAANPTTTPATKESTPSLHARILIISVSQSQPSQYIPTMNAVFAASHARIPIDTLALYDASTFLQQAAFITNGIFVSAMPNYRGILSYLMFGFLGDIEARKALVTPTQDSVDFRAACFCHRRVVDTGYICSICLSIFCEVPENAECLTCGTRLTLGNYGAKPAVVPRKKKKKKRVNGLAETDETGGSRTSTPMPA